MAARRAHNPKVGGSNPPPTKVFQIYKDIPELYKSLYID